MIDNQRVTWTAFAILAMFFTAASALDRMVMVVIVNIMIIITSDIFIYLSLCSSVIPIDLQSLPQTAR